MKTSKQQKIRIAQRHLSVKLHVTTNPVFLAQQSYPGLKTEMYFCKDKGIFLFQSGLASVRKNKTRLILIIKRVIHIKALLTMARIHKVRFELRPRFELKPPFVSPNLLLFFTNQVCKKRVKCVI